MENKTLYHELSEKELKTARETYRKAQAGRSKGFLIWLVLALGLVFLGFLMRTQDGGTSIDNFNETFTVLGVVFALLFVVGNFRSIKKYKAIKEKTSKIDPALAAMFQQELDEEKAEAKRKEIEQRERDRAEAKADMLKINKEAKKLGSLIVKTIKDVEDKADEVVEELATEEPVQPTEPMVEEHPAQEEIEEESMAEMPTAEATEEIPEPSATEPAVGQPSLFGDDEFFVPRPSRRTRMMSLYDDEQRNEVVISKPISEPKPVEVAPTPKQTPAPQPTAQSAEPTKLSVEVLEEEDEFTEVDVETMPIENGEVADSTETQVESAAERDVEMLPSEPYIEPQIEMTVATPAASAVPESEQVLGEVIKSDVQTFGDTIKPKDTAAEQIVKGSVADITKAVGINDRFLLIRDLFGGSSEEYLMVCKLHQLNLLLYW